MSELGEQSVHNEDNKEAPLPDRITMSLTVLRDKLQPYKSSSAPVGVEKASAGIIEAQIYHVNQGTINYEAREDKTAIPNRTYNPESHEFDNGTFSHLEKLQCTKRDENGLPQQTVTLIHSTDDLINAVAVDYYGNGLHIPEKTLLNSTEAMSVVENFIEELPSPTQSNVS